jgi:hypothetical protein
MKYTDEEHELVNTALTDVVDQIGKYFVHHVAGGIGTLPGEPDKWGLVHIRTIDLLQQLLLAKRVLKDIEKPKLLEIGSGVGIVASIAKELGFDVKGIEYSPEYIQMSRKIFPLTSVSKGDALTHDAYGSYDVIYYYGPFKDDDLQEQLELKIENEARRGALILANRKLSVKWRMTGEFDMLAEDPPYSIMLQKRLEPIT